METENNPNENLKNQMMKNWERSRRRGRILAGLLIITAGILLFAREMGANIPHWLFTWPMLLVVLGLFTGIKHSFRGIGWAVLLIIGGVFLVDRMVPDFALEHFLWPIALVAIGLFVLLKPKRRCGPRWDRFHEKHAMRWQSYGGSQGSASPEDVLEINAVFGGIRKNIISKDFKGGEVNAVFGGAEVNLSQADIQNKVELEINCVFGGAKLVVPPHWEIQSELTAVMGSVEDKRPIQKDLTASGKILVLKGNCVFGGIDISSY